MGSTLLVELREALGKIKLGIDKYKEQSDQVAETVTELRSSFDDLEALAIYKNLKWGSYVGVR